MFTTPPTPKPKQTPPSNDGTPIFVLAFIGVVLIFALGYLL